MNIFTQFFSKAAKNPELYAQEINRDLMRRESAIGRQLFGPIPKGVSREFFRLDKNIWVWDEQWTDSGVRKSKNTKYMIKPTEILKSVNGSGYERLSLAEAKNFERAVHSYVKRVKREVYGLTTA